MTDSTQRYYPEERQKGGISLGTVLFGLILLTIGVLWLLDISGVLGVTWTITGAVLLILIGVALLIGAREGSHGGLVFLGIVLSVIVVIGTLATWPSFENGVGERTIAPDSVNALEESYNWGAGAYTVDLRQVEFPDGETNVSVRVGTGEAVVLLPEDTAYRVSWQGGVGNAQVLDREESGFGLDGNYESDNYADQPVRLEMEIQVGIGSIEVRQ